MNSPTVLVLGAHGRLGAAACHAFASAGWSVLAQSRRPASASSWHANPAIRSLIAPLEDTAQLVRLAQGAQAVVYAVNPPYTDWAAQMLPLAEQGMRVATALNAVFMLPGNVYNFGTRMPSVLTETTTQPDSLHENTAKGLLRIKVESLMRERAAQGMRSVVIRAGDFYGAGTGSWFDLAITKDLRNGKITYPGPLNVAHAWAYLPDLAQCFVRVAARPHRPPGPGSFEQFHFAGHTLTGNQLIALIERAAVLHNLRPAQGFRIGSIPWGLMRAVGTVYPSWRELAPMRYLWQVPHLLDDTALREAIGDVPTTDAASAVSDALLALTNQARRAA